jgi:hypothetical protein
VEFGKAPEFEESIFRKVFTTKWQKSALTLSSGPDKNNLLQALDRMGVILMTSIAFEMQKL